MSFQLVFSASGLIKITYGNKKEAENDLKLIEKFNLHTMIIPYKNRNAFDLKLSYSRKKSKIINFTGAIETVKLVP